MCFIHVLFIGQAHKHYDVPTKFQSIVGRMAHSVNKEIEYGFPSLPKTCFIQLERVAKERIFKQLKNIYVNRAKIQRLVNNLTHESSLPLTLANFLNHYHLRAKDLYKFGTFNSFVGLEESPTIKNLHLKMYKFCDVTSVEWIDFLVAYIETPRLEVTEREERLLLMTYYTLYGVAFRPFTKNLVFP